MADITINIPAPALTAGQYFRERRRKLPSGAWSGYTNRTNAAFTVTGLSVGDYEFEFILVNADGTQCPATYRKHTLIEDFTCISFTSQMKKVNGLYHVEVTYTLPPGFTNPTCGWEVEFLQNGNTVNKFTYTALPTGGVIKIPCANVSGLLYIRAQLCNGRVKVCHGNDVGYIPEPPCVPMSDVNISVERQFVNGACKYFLVVTFTQSNPATTNLQLEYRESNALIGEHFKGTIPIAPTATSFKKELTPRFSQGNPDFTTYYVSVIDRCNNGLPVQVDFWRGC